MAYDEVLAQRVREQLAVEAAVIEKAMFGGLAFVLDGNSELADWVAQGVGFARSLPAKT